MSHNIPIVFTTLIGSKQIKKDGDVWISVIIYAACETAKKGDIVLPAQGYGGLSVIVMRNKSYCES